MRKTYSEEIIKGTRMQYDAFMARFKPSDLKTAGMPANRENVWNDMAKCEQIPVERLYYSVYEPVNDKYSPIFHPRHVVSPFLDRHLMPANAPIDSPAGISLLAFKWMVRTTPPNVHF